MYLKEMRKTMKIFGLDSQSVSRYLNLVTTNVLEFVPLVYVNGVNLLGECKCQKENA